MHSCVELHCTPGIRTGVAAQNLVHASKLHLAFALIHAGGHLAKVQADHRFHFAQTVHDRSGKNAGGVGPTESGVTPGACSRADGDSRFCGASATEEDLRVPVWATASRFVHVWEK